MRHFRHFGSIAQKALLRRRPDSSEGVPTGEPVHIGFLAQTWHNKTDSLLSNNRILRGDDRIRTGA